MEKTTLNYIEKCYSKNKLLYIRYNAEIIEKDNGTKKIGGSRPAFSKITSQPKYTNGDYYSLLTGREYQPDKYMLLLDIDNKTEEGTVNGIQLKKLLKLNSTNAPKQRTPSGGYHYLFYVDNEMKEHIPNALTTLKHEGVVYNVDVKFKNGLCNCEPSVIPGYGSYKWENPEALDNIPKLPETLYNIILSNGTNKQNKPVKVQEPTNDETTDEPTYEPTNDEASDNAKFKDIALLLNCLGKKRIHNRMSWINVGICLKCLKAPYEFWDRVSQRSPKYKPGECYNKYMGFEETDKWNIGSLLHWAKEDNPSKLDKIRHLLTSYTTQFHNCTIYKCEFIDTPYLVNRPTEEPTQEQCTFKHMIEQFKGTSKVLCLKSEYGTGKTTLIKQLMNETHSDRCLFITYRRSLNFDIERLFDDLGFVSYLNKEVDNVWNSNKLIVQLDSLLNVMFKSDEFMMTGSFNAKYDYIIIDESEGLLNHFDGQTMKGKDIEIYEFFHELLTLSNKIVCFDADMSNRTLNFVTGYGEYFNIENKHENKVKTLKCINDHAYWTNKLCSEIESHDDNKFRIVVASQSETEALKLEEELKRKYPEIKILLVSGSSKSEIEKEHIYKNVNVILEDVNVFIYTPSIEAGVDITIKIDSVYGIISSKGNSQRAFLQMLARSRNVEHADIYLWTTTVKYTNCFNFWTFKEVKELNRRDHGNCSFAVTGTYITAAPKHLKLYENSLFNKVEELNKHPDIFINYLKTLALSKGYKFECLDIQKEGTDKRPQTVNIKIEKNINCC